MLLCSQVGIGIFNIYSVQAACPYFVFVIFFQIAAIMNHLSYIYVNGSQIEVNEYIASMLNVSYSTPGEMHMARLIV
jgi:hypothetical protein